MSKSLDQDLDLKLRFRRVLFCQGYWSPIEVELSQYENLGTSVKRRSLTDLDVLGIKYDKLFTPFRVVGDCKSGKNISDVNRLFWLKGIKDYFGADQAYFIHPVVKSHTRGIAPKLGVRILDEKALLSVEDNLEVTKFALPLADRSVHEAVTELWGIDVPKGAKPTKEQLELKKVYSYLSYSYWYIEQYRNILSIIDHFTSIAPLLNENNDRHVLLAYTGLERFVHSLMEAANYILAQGGTSIVRDTRTYIYGGALTLREKEEFFRLLRNLTQSNEQLDPPYFQDVVELLGRMIRNPSGACDVLRHLNAIYLWCVHLGNNTLLSLDDDGENTAAIVLTRDAAQTFAKVTGMKEVIYSKILAL
jgi:hypothetical protein